jgi:peptidoglycan/LPS O-acetylase OafA/YrhL
MRETMPKPPHRHDLDWLRVFAILLLLYFHTAMIFTAEWGWHVKNAETSNLLLEFNYFLRLFRMPVLFLISGIGTSFALRFRSSGEYLKERGKRLLIPLVFGILAIVPPQIYFERIAHGAPFSSFLDFYPTTFALRPYPQGNTSWHHLWFIFYLFCYSVAALPLFLYLRGAAGERVRQALGRAFRGPALFLPALPLALTLAALLPRYHGVQNVVDDWAYLLYYFIFFVAGYLIGDHEAPWREIERRRRTSLGLALLGITLVNAFRWNGADPGIHGYTLPIALFHGLTSLTAWCWVLAILGYGKRYLSFRNRLLDYASEGIYPFYILHQTVIVVIGFYVVQVEESILAKFLFTSTVALVATIALYEFVVRPYRVTRFLFGMKPERRVGARRMEQEVPAPASVTSYAAPPAGAEVAPAAPARELTGVMRG